MAIQTTTFKGARYIVKFHDPIEWSAEESYEAIESVKHNGFTYISKQPVPAGVEITNEDFWLLWADPNAQMEQLRQLVAGYVEDVDALEITVGGLSDDLANEVTARENADNAVKQYSDETNGAVFITPDELETVSSGIFTLGEVTVDSGIVLATKQNRNIIIVDTVFNINTSILFPSNTTAGSYFVTPSFVGCTFKNATENSNRVCIAGGEQVVFSRFTGCNFVNVDLINDSTYVQDCNMAECYIQSHTSFIDVPNTTAQIRFVNCTVEAESKQLVNAKRLIGHCSGTYEGNASQNKYYFECEKAEIEFDSCWFELAKVLYVKQSTYYTTKPSSFVKLNNSLVDGLDPTTYPNSNTLKFDEPGAVILTIMNTSYSGYRRVIDNDPSDFSKVYGAFFKLNATNIDAFNSTDNGNRFATVDMRKSLIQSGNITFNAAAIEAGTTLDFTLDCGIWHAYAFQIGGGIPTVVAEYLVCGSYEAASTTTSIIELKAPTGYLDGIDLVATKPTNRSPVFNLSISKTGNPIFFMIGLQKVADRIYDLEY